jgi:hypothetical protein
MPCLVDVWSNNVDGGVMSKEIEDNADHVIPRAAERAAQFLGVVQQTCQDEGLGIDLQPARRGRRDDSMVLRAAVPAGRGNNVEIEVFADPQGQSLHVGWIAYREVVGGTMLGGRGLMGDINRARQRNAGKLDNQRALAGSLSAFNSCVFMPVVQQLVDAVQAERGQRANGFLGA